MEMTEALADGSVVLHIAGRVNSANAHELSDRLRALLDQRRTRIVIDLSRLLHISSAGFRCLLRAEKQAEDAGGALILYGLNGLTLELFEIGGFLDIFKIAADRSEALGHS
jgi:anti-anti-sigma factor